MQSILIVGPKKSGKTSLALNLMREIAHPPVSICDYTGNEERIAKLFEQKPAMFLMVLDTNEDLLQKYHFDSLYRIGQNYEYIYEWTKIDLSDTPVVHQMQIEQPKPLQVVTQPMEENYVPPKGEVIKLMEATGANLDDALEALKQTHGDQLLAKQLLDEYHKDLKEAGFV